jgi:hypothetical protein
MVAGMLVAFPELVSGVVQGIINVFADATAVVVTPALPG